MRGASRPDKSHAITSRIFAHLLRPALPQIFRRVQILRPIRNVPGGGPHRAWQAEHRTMKIELTQGPPRRNHALDARKTLQQSAKLGLALDDDCRADSLRSFGENRRVANELNRIPEPLLREQENRPAGQVRPGPERPGEISPRGPERRGLPPIFIVPPALLKIAAEKEDEGIIPVEFRLPRPRFHQRPKDSQRFLQPPPLAKRHRQI